MAKLSDLNLIRDFAKQELEEYGSELLDFLTMEDASNCLTMIYVTNNITTGFVQDYENNISVLSSPTRIAIIYQGLHSFYKVDGVICEYNAIEDDMNAIRLVLDAALMRWEERGV